jgi:hypothetical protein
VAFWVGERECSRNKRHERASSELHGCWNVRNVSVIIQCVMDLIADQASPYICIAKHTPTTPLHFKYLQSTQGINVAVHTSAYPMSVYSPRQSAFVQPSFTASLSFLSRPHITPALFHALPVYARRYICRMIADVRAQASCLFLRVDWDLRLFPISTYRPIDRQNFDKCRAESNRCAQSDQFGTLRNIAFYRQPRSHECRLSWDRDDIEHENANR